MSDLLMQLACFLLFAAYFALVGGFLLALTGVLS